jgi:hypothetical protein
MMRWIGPLFLFALTAALAFYTVLNTLPGRIMHRAMERLEARGEINSASHAPPVTEASRDVVRPSPDLMYSICVFNLDAGPLLITAPWPRDGNYASVSFYDDATNNFAVVSDRDVDENRRARIFLQQEDFPFPPGHDVDQHRTVTSPSARGVALFRMVYNPADLETADARRRQFVCEAAPQADPVTNED